MSENFEKIGTVVDDLESLICALSLKMPAELHVEQLKNILPEKVKILKEAVINESGENPWK